MPAQVTLRNRIPEIMALGLPQRTGALTAAVAETIAEGARAQAPTATGRLRDSIEAKPRSSGKGLTHAAAVVAVFYWFFVEFGIAGTTRVGARPFMVPAAEQARLAINTLAREMYLEL